MSCVIRVTGGGRGVLLTGDIEREQEATLVAGQGTALQSHVLAVPHHGSKTSLSAPFLDAVQPRIAIFQAATAIGSPILPPRYSSATASAVYRSLPALRGAWQ